MSFLQAIQSFSKEGLNPTVTVETDRFGRQTRSDGVRTTSTGSLIIGDELSDGTLPDKEDPSAQIEYDYFESDKNSGGSHELSARIAWKQTRNQWDGLSCGSSSLPRIAFFVLEKTPHERHFDTFAFHLHQQYHLEQVDHSDLVRKAVLEDDSFQAIIFPGGSVFDVHKHLTEAGAKAVAKFVHRGGGYVGVCAGAFLATGRGYGGAESGWQLIAKTSWCELGKAEVKFTAQGPLSGNLRENPDSTP